MEIMDYTCTSCTNGDIHIPTCLKSTFLNGEFEEEVYVKRPFGYLFKGKEDKILHLKKTLYGLK